MRVNGAATFLASSVAAENQKNWSTPTGDDANNVTRASGNYQSLARDVQKDWPTPLTGDARNNGGEGPKNRVTQQLNARAGGRLNPSWVEQLMGWENGWTALPTEVYGRLRKASRSTRGKRRAPSTPASTDAPTG